VTGNQLSCVFRVPGNSWSFVLDSKLFLSHH